MNSNAQFNLDHVTTAMCMWEAVIESSRPMAEGKRTASILNLGATEARDRVAYFSRTVESAWAQVEEGIKDAYGEPYDWSLIPELLEDLAAQYEQWWDCTLATVTNHMRSVISRHIIYNE